MFLLHLIIANIAVIIAIRFKGAFHKLIAFGIAVCVALPFLSNRTTTTIAFVSLALFALLTALYGWKERGLSKIESVAIVLTGVVMALSIFMKHQHLPYASVTRILMIIPLASLIIVLIQNKKVTKEVSVLLYWAFYALSQVWNMLAS
jgi:hypothetical protein